MSHLREIKSFLQSPSDFYQRSKFVQYMNEYAHSLNMFDSHFDTPSGASSTAFSSAYDLHCMLEVLRKNKTLRSFCETEFYHIGDRKIHNSALSDALSLFMAPIAVKTGTWGNNNKSLCLYKKDFSLCIMFDNPAFFNDIFKIASQIQNQSFSDHSVGFYGYLNGRIIKQNENKKFIPASTTKILTAICAYDICKLNSIVTVKHSDIMSGSGSLYHPGESLTMSDAVKIMLMESSNTLANAVARVCGKKL